MHIDDLDTPFLLVHLDALEENLDRAQAYCDEHGMSACGPTSRPTSAWPSPACRWTAAPWASSARSSARPRSWSTAASTATSSSPTTSSGGSKRLAALAPRTRLTVAADSEYTVRGLSEAMTAAGTCVGVVVELDQGRTGVETPADIAELAALIDSLPAWSRAAS